MVVQNKTVGVQFFKEISSKNALILKTKSNTTLSVVGIDISWLPLLSGLDDFLLDDDVACLRFELLLEVFWSFLLRLKTICVFEHYE